MTTMCIQCAMKAIAEGRKPELFDETIDDHMARCHPDPQFTATERKELERKLAEKLKMNEQLGGVI